MQLPTNLTSILILFFLIITFVISVIEKLADWNGTISYIKESFKDTIIKKLIKPLIATLIVLEFLSLTFLVMGIYQLFATNEKDFALFGCLFSTLSILYMLIGQRIAKDYPGATSLGVYFIISVFGVFLLN